jgi:dihydrofolate reductase
VIRPFTSDVESPQAADVGRARGRSVGRRPDEQHLQGGLLVDLDRGSWSNTTLVKDDAGDAIAGLKQEPGKYLALFGSPSLTVSLLERGHVDELRVMVNPILLGAGKTLFTGLKDRLPLTLTRTTTFSSGNVLLHYRPAGG